MLASATSTSSNELALSALYRATSAELFGMVSARCGDRFVAEEILAQTFESAARQFGKGRGDEVTPAWLTTVAKRRVVDHWRQRSRTRDLVSRLAGRTVAHPDDRREPEIWSAIDSLAPNQRAVLVLRYVDDWSVAEIAEGLELSYAAAESLLARARRSLRAALNSKGYER